LGVSWNFVSCHERDRLFDAGNEDVMKMHPGVPF